MICPSCSAALSPDARFCGVCGYKLAVPAGKAPQAAPGAPTLAPPSGEDFVKGEPPAARPKGKLGGMPKELVDTVPAHEADALPFLNRDPYLGKILNKRFKIEEKLGEGGFGAVYRGVQAGTGRTVALKLLHPEMTRDKNVLARFRREGEVLCRLSDAHTVTTYDFDQTDDGTLFIAMELLSGKSLHDVFTSEAPIRWERMLGLVAQMCTSLHEAHSMGIVHRDLKPENIHLEERSGNAEFVKILDFGIAKVVRGDGDGGKQVPQLTATGQTLGTLEYMSPEQLMGKQLDGRSDVYALGVLTHEMITNQLPFPDAIGPAALIAAQLKKVPPLASSVRPDAGIPDSVDKLILRMLAKSRKDRFADVEELRLAIESILRVENRHKASGTPLLVDSQGAEIARALAPSPGTVREPAPVPAAPVPAAVMAAGYEQGPIGWGDERTEGDAVPAPLPRTAQPSRNLTPWLWLLVFAMVGAAAAGALLALR